MSYDIPSISELEAIHLLNKHYAEVITSKKMAFHLLLILLKPQIQLQVLLVEHCIKSSTIWMTRF